MESKACYVLIVISPKEWVPSSSVVVLPWTSFSHTDTPTHCCVLTDVPTPDAEAEAHPVDLWAADLYSL